MTEWLPLFPLHSVLLPSAHLPLHVFEPRYRELTVDLITEKVPDRRFGVIALRPSPTVEVTELGQLYEIGCATLLRQAKRLPDGRYDIVTTGERRFRLRALHTTRAPYLVGEIDWVPDAPMPTVSPDTVTLLADSARAAHRRYCTAAWEPQDWTTPAEDTSLSDLGHLIAADALLTVDDRQALLEETRPLHRLRMASRVLNREARIISTLRAVPAPPAEFRTQLSPN
ncbi:hypothetical protein EV193_108214 [Herbihabitans rhizosphaerae]|uniref:Lon N-terminal domain-containing protein n=1 Tax=Herbihabitans rhizosphaerae TaxID=1872711 RepID=A0A4Q7KJQ5_9PSEU|nr:LON peptidase substrate-binding domain-containing protein [Herbihabitans rhizosphaerae]RZS34864.1 hypothetical protein EV193_108214 [Herbihabitans rhizosphaerae]